MASEKPDLPKRDVPKARRRDRAARRKHMEFHVSRINFTGFKQRVPGLEKLARVALNAGDRLLQEATVDVNPGGQTRLNFQSAA